MFKKLGYRIRLRLIGFAHKFLRDRGFVVISRGDWALIRGQFWNVEDRVRTARTKKVINHQRNVLLKASRRLRRLLADSDKPFATRSTRPGTPFRLVPSVSAPKKTPSTK